MSMTLVEVRAVGLVLDVSAMCDSAAGIAALYCGGVLRQVVAVGFGCHWGHVDRICRCSFASRFG